MIALNETNLNIVTQIAELIDGFINLIIKVVAFIVIVGLALWLFTTEEQIEKQVVLFFTSEWLIPISIFLVIGSIWYFLRDSPWFVELFLKIFIWLGIVPALLFALVPYLAGHNTGWDKFWYYVLEWKSGILLFIIVMAIINSILYDIGFDDDYDDDSMQNVSDKYFKDVDGGFIMDWNGDYACERGL